MLRIIARVSLGLVLLVPPDEAAAPRLIDPENSGASNTVFTIDSARTEDSAGAKKTFVGGLFSIRAFAYPSWWRGNYASAESERQLDALKATGANAVSIIPTVYVSSGSAHDFRATNNTESDANVIHAIQDAHARGLDVMLKPHIDSVDGTWRAQFNPADPKAWFAGYKALIVKYAQIAADTRVSMLSVGCEFTKLTGPQHRADWLDLIAAVRAVYKGPLTYAASWGEEAKSLAFWDTLDVIGVDHYANLTASAAPSVGQLVDAWTTAPLAAYGKPPILFYRDLAAAHGKPLLFTEIGYRSLDGANREPWNFWTGGRADPQEQADAYTAFFQVASQYGGNWLMGAHLWNWEPLTSGNTPTGFTPQGKPAEAVIHDWFSGASGGGGGNPPPVVNESPLAADDSASTTVGVAKVIDVLANDKDSDGSLVPGTLVVVANPAHGKVAVASGKITYTPNASFTGTDVFTYKVADDDGAFSKAAKVMVAVQSSGGGGGGNPGGGNDGYYAINGTPKPETLAGSAGKDEIHGGGGGDIIYANGSDDRVYGDAGNDKIYGGSGNDWLAGGAGNDILHGGTGADVFVVQPGTGQDRFWNFEPGVDKADVSAFGIHSFGELQKLFQTQGSSTVVRFNGGDELVLPGIAVKNLDADDFMFA